MNKEHEILIIAKNTNGIVARIMSLFNRRGYASEFIERIFGWHKRLR